MTRRCGLALTVILFHSPALGADEEVTSVAATFPPARRLDLELSAFTSTPERFSFCAGFHPGRPVEVDGCLAVDRSFRTLTSHVFYRKRWAFPARDGRRGFLLGLGPGAGLRGTLFCPYSVCAASFGPEVLLSLEAVQFLSPRFGVTLQLDAGVALFWTAAAPGLIQHGFRLPLRLLAGVAL